MHLLQATLFQIKSVLIKSKRECDLEYSYLDKRVRPEAVYYTLQFYKGNIKKFPEWVNNEIQAYRCYWQYFNPSEFMQQV